MASPVILVSAGFPPYDDYMGQTYSRPLEAVGAVPLHLPYLERIEPALALADGVLLGFGGDIEPARYGGAAHPTLTAVSPRRDAFELALAEAALECGLPVLGICRGMQLLNVVRGGTLHPDRSAFPAEARTHPGGDWERWRLVREAVLSGGTVPEHPGHSIHIRPDSRLAAALGGEPTWVNSYHHQAVRHLGAGVVPVAWAADGIVEALELEADAWVVGVQWELQESWKEDDRFLGVFAAFVEAAAAVSLRAPG